MSTQFAVSEHITYVVKFSLSFLQYTEYVWSIKIYSIQLSTEWIIWMCVINVAIHVNLPKLIIANILNTYFFETVALCWSSFFRFKRGSLADHLIHGFSVSPRFRWKKKNVLIFYWNCKRNKICSSTSTEGNIKRPV